MAEKLYFFLFQLREEVSLTHFSYHDWPGSTEEAGQVPSSTHGLLGLVEHALAHQEQSANTGPIAVHCRYRTATTVCCSENISNQLKLQL